MTVALALFYLAGALTLGGALGVVMARNIVYAALAWLVALMGVACLFLLVFAEFLALVQVLIYGGATVIVILFVLVRTRLQDFRRLSDNPQWPVAALVALGIFGVLSASVLLTGLRTTERRGVDLEVLGDTLLLQAVVPFVFTSLVLLVALVGAAMMVRGGGGGPE